MGSDKRVSRSERSGRYGSAFDRDDRDDRDTRSRRRDSEYKRYRDERSSERYDDYRDYDSPERDRMRDRERRNSDRSEDGYHSDGDYMDHDYRQDYYMDEKESKTIMLRGLPININENDIRELVESFEGPQPADVRLMKRKTGEVLSGVRLWTVALSEIHYFYTALPFGDKAPAHPTFKIRLLSTFYG